MHSLSKGDSRHLSIWIFILLSLIDNLPLSNKHSCLRNLGDRTVVGFILDHTFSVYHHQAVIVLLIVLNIDMVIKFDNDLSLGTPFTFTKT